MIHNESLMIPILCLKMNPNSFSLLRLSPILLTKIESKFIIENESNYLYIE